MRAHSEIKEVGRDAFGMRFSDRQTSVQLRCSHPVLRRRTAAFQPTCRAHPPARRARRFRSSQEGCRVARSVRELASDTGNEIENWRYVRGGCRFEAGYQRRQRGVEHAVDRGDQPR